MRTTVSSCLGLSDNGKYKSRPLVLVPYDRPQSIMTILEGFCILLPKALQIRAIKDTLTLTAPVVPRMEAEA